MKRKQEEGEEAGGVNNRYGDGGSWVRGPMVGKGSFGSVYMANLRNPRSRYCCFPKVMAVKSAEVSVSGTLQKEKEVLINVQGCPNVVKCFGEEITMGVNGGGEMVYNILLEYASGGTLATLIKNHSSPSSLLPESDIRRYTRSILRGLSHIHQCGYVHCDLKPENILLVPSTSIANAGSSSSIKSRFFAKIADFGLAKRMVMKQDKKKKRRLLNDSHYLRGTARYMSPEAVAEGIQEPPCDIWALGCVVLEMLTGKPPWDDREKDDGLDGGEKRKNLLSVIGSGRELPEIPSQLSKVAKDFLKGCFVRKAMFRFTAEMLLYHPFVADLDDKDDDEAEAKGEQAYYIEEEEEVLDVGGVSSSVFRLSSNADDEFGSSLIFGNDSLAGEEDFPLCESQVIDDKKKVEAI